MKGFKKYFQWRKEAEKKEVPIHVARHYEEVIQDISGDLDVYLTALFEASAHLPGHIESYRADKMTDAELCIKLRTLKRLTTVTLMKLETGWE